MKTPMSLDTPGEIMGYLLQSNGMTIMQLAEKTGIPMSILRRIMFGSARITPNIAMALSMHLGLAQADWELLQEIKDGDVDVG